MNVQGLLPQAGQQGELQSPLQILIAAMPHELPIGRQAPSPLTGGRRAALDRARLGAAARRNPRGIGWAGGEVFMHPPGATDRPPPGWVRLVVPEDRETVAPVGAAGQAAGCTNADGVTTDPARRESMCC